MKALELRNEEVFKAKEEKKKVKNLSLKSNNINFLIEKGKVEFSNPLKFLK